VRCLKKDPKEVGFLIYTHKRISEIFNILKYLKIENQLKGAEKSPLL
jgi:hypothetical protein